MNARLDPLPPGQHITPNLAIADAAAALDFYARAFGAREIYRLTEPGSGRVAHAEVEIGQARFMLAGEYPDFRHLGPTTLGGSSVLLQVYVADVDAFAASAVAAGANQERPPRDEFYGERVVTLRDPFGHRWMFSARIEDVPPEEVVRRFEAMMRGS